MRGKFFQNSFLINIVKNIFLAFKAWRQFIIGTALVFFAILTIIKFLPIAFEIPIYITLGITITSLVILLISFIIFKFFPERFLNWNLNEIKRILNQSESVNAKLFVLIFISPLANFFMAFSLSIFIFSFLNNNIKILWENSIVRNETIYQFLAVLTIGIFVGIVFMFFLYLFACVLAYIFTWDYRKINPEKIKHSFIRYLGNTHEESQLDKQQALSLQDVIFLILVLIFLFLSKFIDVTKMQFFENLEKFMGAYFVYPLVIFIKFIVGIIPLGWFYELFIGSIWRKLDDYKK